MTGADVGQQRLHRLLEDLGGPGQVERVRRRVADELEQMLGGACAAGGAQAVAGPVDRRRDTSRRLRQRRVHLAVRRSSEPRLCAATHTHTQTASATDLLSPTSLAY